LSSPLAPILLASASTTDIFMMAAASVFFIAGVALLAATLRGSLIKSRLTLEEDVRRKQAESQFWRTMENAVVKLGEAVAEIDEKIRERTETLDRLSREANELMAKIEARRKELEADAPRPAREAPARGEGKVVDMKTASAALARRNARICEMFDGGDTIQDISRETGLSLGEIELILAIRDKGQTSAGIG
jgi:hypothetical protein